MEKLNINSEKRPIGVFASLMAGFDRIAGNPILIIPPLLLDLYLWFGPHLKISTLITQFMTDVYRTPGVESLNSEQLVFLRESMTVLAERYNLFSNLSSVPAGMPFNIMFAILASFLIGLPSLMALRMPVTTPLGLPISYDLQDPALVVSLWLVFGLVGLGLGGLYHRNLAKQLAPEKKIFQWVDDLDTLNHSRCSWLSRRLYLFYSVCANRRRGRNHVCRTSDRIHRRNVPGVHPPRHYKIQVRYF